MIDGRLNDEAWSQAGWSENFVDIRGAEDPIYPTRFKMLWDENYLYVGAELIEEQIWATQTDHDDIVYLDNDFEIFIDPDGDTHNYVEVEVNALNTVLDLMLVKPYRDGGPMLMDWNPPELRTAVYLKGSLNDGSDADTAWYVEMAIPLKSIFFHDKKKQLSAGTWWRVNFSRVHYSTRWNGEAQVKLTDEHNKILPEFNWVWSPQGVVNMHYPEMWGLVLFTDKNSSRIRYARPRGEEVKWILRQLYYQQRVFFTKYGHYAKHLEKLGLKKLPLEYKISAAEGAYRISAWEKGQTVKWSINESGRTWSNKHE